MEIRQVLRGDEYWGRLIDFAKKSSWEEGPGIAKYWEEHKFLSWEGIFAAVEGGEIAGHCSLNESDSVCGVEYTPYVQAIFVDERFRGGRLSQKLISRAMRYAVTQGFAKVYIVSALENLFEKFGFIKIGAANDSGGAPRNIFVQEL